MHLIYDIHLVSTGLGSKTNLFHQRPDIVHRVVTGGIQFVDVERSALIKRYTGMTVVTSLPIRAHICAIDGLCQDPGTSRLTNPPGTAEKESMRQLAIFNGVFQGSSDMCLTHNRR